MTNTIVTVVCFFYLLPSYFFPPILPLLLQKSYPFIPVCLLVSDVQFELTTRAANACLATEPEEAGEQNAEERDRSVSCELRKIKDFGQLTRRGQMDGGGGINMFETMWTLVHKVAEQDLKFPPSKKFYPHQLSCTAASRPDWGCSE